MKYKLFVEQYFRSNNINSDVLVVVQWVPITENIAFCEYSNFRVANLNFHQMPVSMSVIFWSMRCRHSLPLNQHVCKN